MQSHRVIQSRMKANQQMDWQGKGSQTKFTSVPRKKIKGSTVRNAKSLETESTSVEGLGACNPTWTLGERKQTT